MAQRDTMNISVSAEQKAFVKAQVQTGRYRNDSEVVREGLRLLEERDRQRRLEEQLLAGLEGDASVDMDDACWASLRERVAASSRSTRRGRSGA